MPTFQENKNFRTILLVNNLTLNLGAKTLEDPPQIGRVGDPTGRSLRQQHGKSAANPMTPHEIEVLAGAR